MTSWAALRRTCGRRSSTNPSRAAAPRCDRCRWYTAARTGWRVPAARPGSWPPGGASARRAAWRAHRPPRAPVPRAYWATRPRACRPTAIRRAPGRPRRPRRGPGGRSSGRPSRGTPVRGRRARRGARSTLESPAACANSRIDAPRAPGRPVPMRRRSGFGAALPPRRRLATEPRRPREAAARSSRGRGRRPRCPTRAAVRSHRSAETATTSPTRGRARSATCRPDRTRARRAPRAR